MKSGFQQTGIGPSSEKWAGLDDGWRACRRRIDALVAEPTFADGAFLTGFKIAYYHAKPKTKAGFNEVYQKGLQELSILHHEVSSLGRALAQSHLLSNHSDPQTWHGYPQQATQLALALRNLLNRIQANSDKIRHHVPREHLGEMDAPFACFFELAHSLIEVLDESASYPPKIDALMIPCEPAQKIVKPGYKQTEVGVIPEEWEVKELGALDPFVTSGSRGWASYYSDRGSLFVRITNMSRDSIYLDLENSKFVNLPAESSEGIRTQLQEHDVLISITADIGISSYVDSCVPSPAFINQHIALVRFHQEKACGKFVSYFLASEAPQRLFRSSTDIGAKAGMSLQTVIRLRAAFPSLPEQHAIAEALSDVDALLAALDRLIAKKRDLKQAAMQQLLTGQTRLPGFTGEWVVKTFGELFNFGGGYSASRDDLSAEGHCYLHYGDIHTSTRTTVNVDSDFAQIPKLDIPLKRVASGSLLEDGDVVFVDASEDDDGVSKHVVVVNKEGKPFISGLHTIVAKPRTDELVHGYRRFCFQTRAIKEQFKFYAVGTKVSGISKSNIPKLTIPVPCPAEQTAIAAVLSDMDAELAALEQRREKTRALKQGMMQELLTGKTRLK